MAEYYAIITDAGEVLLAEAIASGVPVVLTQFAVGDGNGQPVTPDPAMTALTNETYRNTISSLLADPAQPGALVAQLIVPAESGGYTVREVGLFTEDGTLFSVANYPDQLKPPVDSGYAVNLDLRYVLVVSDTSAITVVIQPGDYLTQEMGDSLYLNTALNLREIADAGVDAQAESRGYLGLGDIATRPATDFIPITGSEVITGTMRSSGEFQTQGSSGFRMASGQYGAFWHHDGAQQLYLMVTAVDDPFGSWGSLRPLIVDMVTGQVTFGNGATVTGALNASGSVSGANITAAAGDVVSSVGNVVAASGVYESAGGIRVYSPNNPQAIAFTDTQFGAARWQDYAGGGQVIAGSGEVLCGLQEQQDDNEIHGYWFKPLQKLIWGAWVTVTG